MGRMRAREYHTHAGTQGGENSTRLGRVALTSGLNTLNSK